MPHSQDFEYWGSWIISYSSRYYEKHHEFAGSEILITPQVAREKLCL